MVLVRDDCWGIVPRTRAVPSNIRSVCQLSLLSWCWCCWQLAVLATADCVVSFCGTPQRSPVALTLMTNSHQGDCLICCLSLKRAWAGYIMCVNTHVRPLRACTCMAWVCARHYALFSVRMQGSFQACFVPRVALMH